MSRPKYPVPPLPAGASAFKCCSIEVPKISPQALSLPTDGRKGKVLRQKRKALLVALSSHTNADGTSCYPSLQKLSEETEISLTAIKRYLDDLITLGYVVSGGYAGESGPRVRRLVIPSGSPHSEKQEATIREQEVHIQQQEVHIREQEVHHGGPLPVIPEKPERAGKTENPSRSVNSKPVFSVKDLRLIQSTVNRVSGGMSAANDKDVQQFAAEGYTAQQVCDAFTQFYIAQEDDSKRWAEKRFFKDSAGLGVVKQLAAARVAQVNEEEFDGFMSYMRNDGDAIADMTFEDYCEVKCAPDDMNEKQFAEARAAFELKKAGKLVHF